MREQKPIKVAAFYHFVPHEVRTAYDFEALQEPLKAFCEQRDIKGIILLAPEGINSTVAGKPEDMDAFLAHLKSMPWFRALEYKQSSCEKVPFWRLRVRLKKELITFRRNGADPVENVGTYVPPEEWNDLISQPDVTLLDTRNTYEIKVGTFEGALNPEIETFTQFADYVEEHLDPEKTPKVAMFCTGGIRCERASAWMLSKGFKEVYHLKGGILTYLEKVPVQESKWQGDCFVFDGRYAVGHGLNPIKEGNSCIVPGQNGAAVEF